MGIDNEIAKLDMFIVPFPSVSMAPLSPGPARRS
jgi:hypothetical protein